MRKLAIWLLLIFVWLSGFMTSKVFASESTIVLMDNTTIKTVHHYERSTDTLQMGNWDDVAILNPTAEAECFDRIKLFKGRADRYQQLESCLTGVSA